LGVKRVGGMAKIMVYHTNLKQAVSDTQKMYLIVMGISLLIFGLFMAWILRKILTRPFESMVATAHALSKGVTDARFSQTGNDEFGYLSNFFNHTLDKLFSQQEKLEHMAYYDHLTLIPNRVKFISHVERLLERTKQQSDYMFAVLFIDLDRFKVINDSLGHAIGDELLIEVAHRLEECTRPTDQVSHVEDKASVARFGGDEFAVFLHDVKDISSASRVADRIQAELQEPILIDTHELYTSASIGIAFSASGYEKAEDIMRDADSAMYRAKATGKAHAEIFDEAMHGQCNKTPTIRN
jgi:diguanylate cyclase (GGDEF)-like protein